MLKLIGSGLEIYILGLLVFIFWSPVSHFIRRFVLEFFEDVWQELQAASDFHWGFKVIWVLYPLVMIFIVVEWVCAFYRRIADQRKNKKIDGDEPEKVSQ